MSKNDWIKELKEGDKVYTQGGGFSTNTLTLTTVKKITPKGHVRIENGTLYRNGSHRVDSWTHYNLVQHTPELELKLKAKVHYSHMCHSINAQDMRGKSLDQVQRIYDILKEVK